MKKIDYYDCYPIEAQKNLNWTKIVFVIGVTRIMKL